MFLHASSWNLFCTCKWILVYNNNHCHINDIGLANWLSETDDVIMLFRISQPPPPLLWLVFGPVNVHLFVCMKKLMFVFTLVTSTYTLLQSLHLTKNKDVSKFITSNCASKLIYSINTSYNYHFFLFTSYFVTYMLLFVSHFLYLGFFVKTEADFTQQFFPSSVDF